MNVCLRSRIHLSDRTARMNSDSTLNSDTSLRPTPPSPPFRRGGDNAGVSIDGEIAGEAGANPAASIARRSFFGRVAGGIYGAALASLLERDLFADEPARQVYDLKPRAPHFEPK